MAKKKQTSAEASAGRAKEAADRARARLSAQTGNTDDVDIKRVPLSWWRERWSDKAIRRLFVENFIFVRDAFDENKSVPFRFNDLQAHLHEHVTGRDVILKMRRGGLSTYWLAVNLADAVVLSGRTVRIVPHDPETEEKFRADLKAMYEGLPDHLRPATKRYSELRIVFHDPKLGTVESEIKTQTVQPGREGKGRGLAITNLHLTEIPHWTGNQRKAAVALLIAAGGGKVCVESTPEGIEWFFSIYQDGKTGKGGWKSHFFAWFWNRNYRVKGARIERSEGKWKLVSPDEAKNGLLTYAEKRLAVRILRHLLNLKYVEHGTTWHSPEVAVYIAWRRARIEEHGEPTFLVEYPENDKDCFEQTGRPVIRPEFLKTTCKATAAIAGQHYMIGVDTSGGSASGNPAAIEVIDAWDGRQVFEEKLKLPPDMLAYRVAQVCDLYNRALIVCERNNTGIATVIKLVELGYEDVLYKHLSARNKRAIADGTKTLDEAMEEEPFGFPTTAENKPLAGIKLEEGVRLGYLGLSSEEFCTQALTVCWNDSGSFAALSGYEDDLFMAMAIVWFVRQTTLGQFTGYVGCLPEAGDVR